MKKAIFSLPLLALILIARPLSADATPPTEDIKETESPMPETTIKQVGPPSDEYKKQKRRQRWYRIGLAASAIAIATVGIILASQNKGHTHAHNNGNRSS